MAAKSIIRKIQLNVFLKSYHTEQEWQQLIVFDNEKKGIEFILKRYKFMEYAGIIKNGEKIKLIDNTKSFTPIKNQINQIDNYTKSNSHICGRNNQRGNHIKKGLSESNKEKRIKRINGNNVLPEFKKAFERELDNSKIKTMQEIAPEK